MKRNFKPVRRTMKEPLRGKHTETDRERELSKRDMEFLELLKPQLREFPFQAQVFESYSRVEKALQNAVVESYIQGGQGR